MAEHEDAIERVRRMIEGAEEPESPYGPRLKVGMIARFATSKVDFDEALDAGPGAMADHFDQTIGGVREGHADELRELGFFDEVLRHTGLDVDVGSWEEICADRIPGLLAAIEVARADASEGVGSLLDDLAAMADEARERGCSIGFML